MRFVFLGTGTSAGVPMIGCSCRVCTSDDTRDSRLRTSAAIILRDESAPHESRERVILLDAGPDLRTQALRAGLVRCDAILFTHNHVDHTFGLDEVRQFNVVQRGPVFAYAEEHTQKFLHRVYEHIFDASRNINDSFVATIAPCRIAPSLPVLDLFGLRVTPIRVLHGRLPVLGYRFDAGPGSTGEAVTSPILPLAYLTDLSAIPPESWAKLQGLSTLVIDALRARKHPTHLTIDEAVSIAERVGSKRTYLIHMSHDVSHAEVQAGLPAGVFLAYDGLELS